jgi:hypothetical protein
MEWILLFVAIVVGAAIFIVIDKAKKTKAASDELHADFPDAKIHVSDDDQSYCVVDFSKSKIIIGLSQPRGGILNLEQPYRAVYDFSDIAAVEVQRNGTTIASTNRGSQALGAAAGALAFGGIGAIIGGLSGSSTQQERVRRISLVVKVRDQSQPLHNITFFYWDANNKGVKTTSLRVQQAISNVENFAAHVSNAIYASQEKIDTRKIAPEPTASESITSELKQLWEMKENGALNVDEFNEAKSRLIAGR